MSLILYSILYSIIIFVFIIALRFKILTFKRFFVIGFLALLTQNYIAYKYYIPKPQEIKFKLLPFPDDTNVIFDFEKHFVATYYDKNFIYAMVYLRDKDYNLLDKYYSIFDYNGNQILPWNHEHLYEKNADLFEGRNEENEIIYYDFEGNLMPNFNNKEIYKFDENNIFMKDLENNEFYKIDSKGKILEETNINFNIYYVYNFESDLYPIVNNKIIFESNIKYPRQALYYYDTKTKNFEQLSFYSISNFIQDKAIVVKEDNYFNLVDKDFKEILKNDYDHLSFASNEKYIIAGKTGDDPSILDLNGNKIFSIDCEYLDINDDDIIFYKIKNNEDTLDGILADIKGNILYKINNADDYEMYRGFLFSNALNFENAIIDWYFYCYNWNEIFGDIFYFNKFSKSLKKISSISSFIFSGVIHKNFLINLFENRNELIYSIDKKYYRLKLKQI